MGRLSRIVDWLGTGLMVIAALSVVGSMLVGTADVVGTQLFLSPVHGATEGITELMVVIVFMSLPYTQRMRSHIRVELVYSHFGPRGQAALDALTAAVAFLFFGLLFWQAIHAATFSWRVGERTMSVVRLPIYPAKFAILVGVGIVMAQLLIDLYESVRDALRTDPR